MEFRATLNFRFWILGKAIYVTLGAWFALDKIFAQSAVIFSISSEDISS